LEKIGITRGSWFAGLHVREGGFLPDLSYHSYRDADIATYLPAAAVVIEKGGSVIRMGDKTMQTISEAEGIKDYVHSDIHSDWMDIFCFSQAKFVIGTTSGAFDAACAFGVPGALTNWAPMGHGPYTRRDIWIPKLYWSVAEQRYLTFQESLSMPMRMFGRTEQYEEAGFQLIDNTPEEISDLVSEMLERLDGDISYSQEDEELQARFKTFLASEPMYATTARVGRAFLHKYAALLEDPARHSGIV
jgi:putative glycosyltransferase (TIGR04372 family)